MMKQRNIGYLAALCLLSSLAATAATTVWNPAANPQGTGLWTESANWTGTIPAGGTMGDYKCVFNVRGARECIVNTAVTVSQVVQGDNGPGETLRIVSGGRLDSGYVPNGSKNWTAIGYNNTAHCIVETDGELNAGDHLWIALNSGAQATLTLAGGTVNVYGMFGVGWSGGTGRVEVNAGLLNLNGWSDSQSITTGSTLDITEGAVRIAGDHTGGVATMVADGRVTAYGGKGKVVYDYNVSAPGKTTIRALPPIEGDLNSDHTVDMLDLELLVGDWLFAGCGSVADLDGGCSVDFNDFAALSRQWLSGVATRWHIAHTEFPTDDLVVTPYYAQAFGIAGDGVTDVTEPLQTALVAVSNLGGGTLFLPSGMYKVTGTLTVPAKVTLRGDWRQPSPGEPVEGTILMAYAGRGDENGAPFLGLGNCAGVRNLSIWYPEQTADAVAAYPPTIQRVSGGNQGVENVTFVNAYFGFTTYQDSITASPFVRNVFGTPLRTGLELDCLADVGRVENVHFSPDYWKHSGLPGAPTADQHAQWIYDNGTGIIARRIDWSYFAYATVEGYHRGFALLPSRNLNDLGTTPNGQAYAFTLKNCDTGVYVERSSYAGFQFTRFDIQNAQTGVYLGPDASQAALFHTCTMDAANFALHNQGTARVLMMSCNIEQGGLRISGGYLSVINSDFNSPGGPHVSLYSSCRGASILGSRFAASPVIQDYTSYPVNIDHAPLAVTPLPPYDYKKPTQAFTADKPDLFVVTEAPYNAKADAVTDDTPAFQAALADAAANGGGIVFAPGGEYRLDGTLTVPTGVELRGIFDIPHSTSARGSVLGTYAGKNDANAAPFIQIAPGAGVRGLTIHYPGQVFDPDDTVNYGMTPYPWMIRGLGSDIYVINVASTIPYQLLDLATHRCDRHYVDYMLSTALKTGIHVGGGTQNGQIHNCQFNPSAYTHQATNYESIPFNTSDGIHDILWRDSRPYLFGDMADQVLHQNFVFGGVYGVHLVSENGAGPSGYCMGMGVDQCTNAMQIDAIGAGGLDMINSQIVTVNCGYGRYLETGPSLEGDFRMFASSGWGCHQYSAVINGGDVELQLFHLARDGESGVFEVHNDAALRNLGGNLTDYLGSSRPFLTIAPTATAEFIGNIINTSDSQMPVSTFNVNTLGNLRVQ